MGNAATGCLQLQSCGAVKNPNPYPIDENSSIFETLFLCADGVDLVDGDQLHGVEWECADGQLYAGHAGGGSC